MTGVAFYEFGERESTKPRLELSRVDKEIIRMKLALAVSGCKI